MRTFTIGYPFCGSGIGACGSDAAVFSYKGESATFLNVGGIDFDAEACEDFRKLTGAKALCADVTKLMPEDLISFWGPTAPNALKSSPPCKAGSGLLPLEVAASAEYQAMNRLGLDFLLLVFRTYRNKEARWTDGARARRPSIIIMENVPSLSAKTRAGKVVRNITRLLKWVGYLVDVRTHDLGKEGGLPQRRRRLAIIARDPVRCPAPVEMPPEKPLRTIGEAIGPLPWPDDPRAGAMHRLPNLSLENCIRLALIGIDWKDGRKPKWDWRDLPPRGQVAEWLKARGLWPATASDEEVERLEEALVGAPSQKRNEVYRRQPVQPWNETAPTVTGPGGAGLVGVQDPRVEDVGLGYGARAGAMGVAPWNEPSGTVLGSARATGSNMPATVADERIASVGLTHARAARFSDQYRIQSDASPSATVTGATDIQTGAPAIADSRALNALAMGAENPGRHTAKYNVTPDSKPARTVTGAVQVGSGGPSVADGRVMEKMVWNPSFNGGLRERECPRCGAKLVQELDGWWCRNGDVHPELGDIRWLDINGGPLPEDAGGSSAVESISEKRTGRPGFMQVSLFDEPSATVMARTEATAGQSMGAVADERILEGLAEGRTGDNAGQWNGRPGYRQVTAWDEPSAAVLGNTTSTSGSGPGAVQDERAVEGIAWGAKNYNGLMGLLPWDRPATTVTGAQGVASGTAAVADPRMPPPRPVISLGMALALLARGWKKPKGALAPAILAPDGTWHRPLTTLELGVLQTLPPKLEGKPLVLAGKSDRRWREHIGNGIPRDAAEAWGRQLLESLLRSSMGEGFRLLAGGVWVQPEIEQEAVEAA